ncbi:beta-1,4 N-acetylgalactosaminyltransferase 2-like [Saccoglossus kowalevskii]|uniref:Beta-1,4 N-acetylgalactosaminyltransferase 2-like n=1 Tax=Saccoglossus kowalevskii TaxID=10224 RepID=A0ABM0MG96_SACKO|nr:PREDICTED: beta-1,4 N-acetylgalactosaminyltransferase 2-like [Saccoglossus kowalevskii]
MTIIVADDSQQPIPIKKDHVKYYTMSFRDGSYPGINLALSQVETKYVLYADDDYVFTNETRLELMLEKLENPHANIDIVVPNVIGLPNMSALLKFGFHEHGICGLGVRGKVSRDYLMVPQYPQCKYGDFFENVLLAKTVIYRKIGYYPPIKPCTHVEFWTNAIGKARIVLCDDVRILHKHGFNRVYNKFRVETLNIEKKRDPSPLFENDLCYSHNYDFPMSKEDVMH